jgi:hypothetical protein
VPAAVNGSVTLNLSLPAQSVTFYVIPAPTAVVAAPVYQINSGGAAVGTFTDDNYFVNGSSATTTHAIDLSGVTNPAPAACYQSVRSNWAQGDIVYTLPNLTPSKSYTVRLHFEEMYETVVGNRQFNVSINGTQVLTNFDQLAAAGAMYKAVVREFTTTADAQGNLTITFHTVKECANIAAIEIK